MEKRPFAANNKQNTSCGKGTKGCGNMQEINRSIDRFKKRANKAIYELELMGKAITADSFEKARQASH